MTKYETYQQSAMDEEVDVRPHGVEDAFQYKREMNERKKTLPKDFDKMQQLRVPVQENDMIEAHINSVLKNAPPPPAPTSRGDDVHIEHYIPAPDLSGMTASRRRRRQLYPLKAMDFLNAPSGIFFDAQRDGVCEAILADMGRRVFIATAAAAVGAIILMTRK
jgi:hypothetical protein